MLCRTFKLPDGAAIVCMARPPRKRCRAPGCSAWSAKLCDWKLHTIVEGKRKFTGKTCDVPLCESHARNVGPDKDLCPAHYASACAQGFCRGDD